MSHYKPYPAYKDSGVGWLGHVPTHWEIAPLWSVYRPLKRTGFADEPLLSVYRDYGVVLKASRDDNRNRASDDLGPYQLVEPGNLVTNKMKTWQGSIAVSELRGIVSPAYFVYEPIRNVFGRYIHHLMRCLPYITGYMSVSKGIRVGQWDLDPDYFRTFPVLFPPRGEQERIVKALDSETARIDALIAKKSEFIELLTKKRQALITHAVTKGLNPKAKMKDSGVEWIGEVPEHWAVCKLSYRYSEELGKMLDEKKMTGNHPVPYLRNKDVQWQSINASDLPTMDISPSEIDRYTIKDGDLLVCEGGDVGRAAIWRGDNSVIGYQKALHRLRAVSGKRDSVEFYFYALFAAKINGVFEESDTKSTISHLPAEKFREYRFAFPPLDEQQNIVEFLTSMTKRIALISEKTQLSIDLLKKRRSALITAAVTGQIDLRESA